MSATAVVSPSIGSPAERVAAAKRAKDVMTGKVVIRSACPECCSPSLERSEDGLHCVSCGRTTRAEIVKRIRQQRIRELE